MPWGQDRPSARLVRSGEPDALRFARPAGVAEQSDSTTLHPESQSPNREAGWHRQSADHGLFFEQVLRIGAGDPVFGPLPVGFESLEGATHALVGHERLCEPLLETDLGN